MPDGTLYYIEDKTDGRLGRNVVNHDPRNRQYPIRALIGDAPIKTQIWTRHLPIFDQGHESSCTAQAAVGVLCSEPNFSDVTFYDTSEERFSLYREAQKVDPWPGEDYEGSSTDAPFKVLRDRGHIKEWRWCFGLDDVLRTLSNHGPVAIGVNWHEGMFETNGDGYIEPSGRVEGGHAVQLIGIDANSSYVFGINSWGDWGAIDGWFRLRFNHLDALLKADGEAVTVVLDTPPTPEPKRCDCCGQALP